MFKISTLILSIVAILALVGTSPAAPTQQDERVIELRRGERIEIQCDDADLIVLPDSSDEVDLICGAQFAVPPTRTPRPSRTARPSNTPRPSNTARPTNTPRTT